MGRRIGHSSNASQVWPVALSALGGDRERGQQVDKIVKLEFHLVSFS